MKILLLLILTTSFSLKAQEQVKTTDFEGLKPFLEKNNDTTYLVNFWATWCKPCVEEMPAFMKIHDENQDKPFKMLLVSLDFPGQIESRLIPYIQENQIDAEVVVLDDPASNVWIPKVNDKWSGSLPATLFYNRDKRDFYEKKLNYTEIKSILTNYLKE